MTSKSITARENRRRQKLRQRRPRKVHRYGFRPRGNRWKEFAICKRPIAHIERACSTQSFAVSDAAFVWLPADVQCAVCRWGEHAYVPPLLHSYGHLHGTHEHLMAVELLVAMLQRMWQARLEVGHRCYHQFHWYSVSACASCGKRSLCDVDSLRAEIEKTTSRIVLSPQIRGGWFSAAVRMEWSEAVQP